MLSTWTQYTDRVGTEGLRQHLIFRDRPGSLGAVTGVLSKVGVNILEAAVFCTADGALAASTNHDCSLDHP